MSPALALRTNLVAVDIGLISDLLCYSLQSAISTTTFYTTSSRSHSAIKVPLGHQGSIQPHQGSIQPHQGSLQPHQGSLQPHRGSTQPSRFHSAIKVSLGHQGSISTVKVPYQPSRFHTNHQGYVQ